MNFPLYIAKRYLISKKSHNIINIISAISVTGITIGTMALIIVLSVFNGFENLIISLFNTFNPDLVISIKEGKTFNADTIPENEIRNIPGLIYYTDVIEENVMVKYSNKQHIVRIKGVSEDFMKMSRLDSMLIDGRFVLESDSRNFAILGAGVAYLINANLNDLINPISVYAVNRSKNISFNPEANFNTLRIFPSAVFSVQQDFDSKYVIVPLRFSRKLLDYTNELTAIEIGLSDDADRDAIQKRIQQMLGDGFSVKNRFQQQALLYKVMKSEKWGIFMILSFILLIATFNVIGSLSMLIIDKKKDITILWNLGADHKMIKKIFLFEGLLITIVGAVLGLLLGSIICWIQQQFGIIQLQGTDNSFVVNAYPVQMVFIDFVYIFLTVFIIGFAAAWYPVRRISKKYLNEKL